MAKRKSWQEKFDSKTREEIKIIDKEFWGQPQGSRMLIATPKIIQDYLYQTPFGTFVSPQTMRDDLAEKYNADFMCPMTAGIFLRIVAELHFERYQNDANISDMAPFWRVIEENSAVAKKLACGQDFIAMKRREELV